MTELREPHIRINGWSIGISPLLQTGVVLVAITGAWYNVQFNQQVLFERMKEVQAQVEISRVENAVVVKEIQERLNDTTTKIARVEEQVRSLTLLVADLKKGP